MTTISTPRRSAASITASAKVRQRRFGSTPRDSTRSRSAAGRAGGEDRVVRPVDLARLALGHPDRRPGDLEVVELLRVDLGDPLGIERDRDRLERGGRRAGGVVPAGEGRDQDRRAELRRIPLPLQRLHTASLRGRALGRHAGRRPRRRARSMDGSGGRADPPPRSPSCVPGSASRAATRASRKERQTARNGSAYLSLRLRDRSGTIAARAFRDADRIGLRFERGDAIAVRGKVERFRGELVAELDDVRRLEPGSFDPAEFLPAAYRSAEELEGFLEHLAREVHDPALRGGRRRGRLRRPAGGGVPPRALHAALAPRLPRRAARAHGRGRDAGARDLRSSIRGSTPTC